MKLKTYKTQYDYWAEEVHRRIIEHIMTLYGKT
jgi:hypothetical protein